MLGSEMTVISGSVMLPVLSLLEENRGRLVHFAIHLGHKHPLTLSSSNQEEKFGANCTAEPHFEDRQVLCVDQSWAVSRGDH